MGKNQSLFLTDEAEVWINKLEKFIYCCHLNINILTRIYGYDFKAVFSILLFSCLIVFLS